MSPFSIRFILESQPHLPLHIYCVLYAVSDDNQHHAVSFSFELQMKGCEVGLLLTVRIPEIGSMHDIWSACVELPARVSQGVSDPVSTPKPETSESNVHSEQTVAESPEDGTTSEGFAS